MPNNNRLRRIYNLKKKSKDEQEKAYEYGDGFHQDMPGSTPKQDRKMMRHQKRSEDAHDKAKKLWKKHEAKEDGKHLSEDTGFGGALLGAGVRGKKSPFGYTAPVDVFAIIEEEERSPIGYVMDGAKVKDTSPNQGFSSKDFHLVQKLQGNYKEPSEGSFKTNSQNIYASFDSPLEFRGFNKAADIDSGPTAGRTAVAAADRRTQQNAQGLQNAATVVKMGMDIAGFGMDVAGMGTDKCDKKPKPAGCP